ncbi:MAG: hypothetical protein Q8N17_03990 [Burkholderiaceae bacterium]|nr:hypothetical protein [Desulfobacterales bacterium]MDP3135480.1 hypothetical protein [Burkholderiaceae bacterium]
MTADCACAFARFLVDKKKDIQRIARATRGEYEPSDVESEAWLLAQRLPQTKGWTVDFTDGRQQDKFLSYLYQELVRYTELVVRHAVRLDHKPGGDAGDDPHPLVNILASDEGHDPLATLLLAEAAQLQAAEPDAHHSLAAAYLWLLRRLNNDMRQLAQHLLISLSYCYRRMARARMLAVIQQPLPPTIADQAGCFVPKPWRKERMQRIPVQLVLDLDCEPLLWPARTLDHDQPLNTR